MIESIKCSSVFKIIHQLHMNLLSASFTLKCSRIGFSSISNFVILLCPSAFGACIWLSSSLACRQAVINVAYFLLGFVLFIIKLIIINNCVLCVLWRRFVHETATTETKCRYTQVACIERILPQRYLT